MRFTSSGVCCCVVLFINIHVHKNLLSLCVHVGVVCCTDHSLWYEVAHKVPADRPSGAG